MPLGVGAHGKMATAEESLRDRAHRRHITQAPAVDQRRKRKPSSEARIQVQKWIGALPPENSKWAMFQRGSYDDPTRAGVETTFRGA